MNINSPNMLSAYGPRIQRLVILFSLLAILILFSSGCATVGKDFSVTEIYEIKIGKTTQEEIRAMFGSPWRVGIENGDSTWTYGNYQYSLFSAKKAKDLVIRFDDGNIVKSYTFSTTDHNN